MIFTNIKPIKLTGILKKSRLCRFLHSRVNDVASKNFMLQIQSFFVEILLFILLRRLFTRIWSVADGNCVYPATGVLERSGTKALGAVGVPNCS